MFDQTGTSENPAARISALLRMRQLVGGFAGSQQAEDTQPQQAEPFDAHTSLATASPRVLLETMARAKAVARTTSHLRQLRPYSGGQQ